jgi:hypothetical protein
VPDLARRWTIVTVAVTAVVVYGGCALLRYDLASTTVSFVVFAGLFGGTAWFLGHEVAAARAEGPPRPRFVCEEGHVAYEPGVCDCGRRRQPWVPPDVWGPVRRMVWVGLALLVVLMVTGVLLRGSS